eukprot:CAMPEP_0171330264 /NCGR_PEP_ID=MMETSP0878-20121228/1891_1 /TAXON_ID=67004 /ORGANISM="Thalassiosira weissflogii, Strain CCMP1336" /LENGTH=139 /DNA_ID=CAMNT_0011830523 /DNA_START=221 /DNA_END=639 /DNA_ORIENTATION=-
MHQRHNSRSRRNNEDMYGNLESGRRGGAGGRGGMSSHETNANIMEQQNNDRISELSDQVARLKGLTVDIGNEVREQNSLLDNMGDGFSEYQGFVSGEFAEDWNDVGERGGEAHVLSGSFCGFCDGVPLLVDLLDCGVAS